MKGPNVFCINTKKGRVWGRPSSWEEVDSVKKSRTLIYLGKYEECNGKHYIVFRAEGFGTNYIIEL